ncbi:MAG TPA: MBL fold metallo-hydrolase [Acidobacteria bacterium]|nr:MBL fold metallo-hydrolase [Acidobacteriota bacterium]
MEVVVLGSGSKGNSALVRAAGSALLVDAGLSARQLRRRLDAVGQDPARIEAVLLTHEHSDHVAGLRVFRRRFPLPVVANAPTLEATERIVGESLDGSVEQATGTCLEIGPFRVTSFPVPHDAAETVGYVIEAEGVRLGYATDLGHVTHLVHERLASCELVVIEANHDRQMLLDGPYPWATKQRVASRHGHLSNDHAASLLPDLARSSARAVVLAHLSETNNDPLLALAAVKGALHAEGLDAMRVELARQDAPAAGVAV